MRVDFHRILAVCPLGVAVWRAHGDDPADLVLEWANQAASQDVGFDLESHLGKRLVETFPLVTTGVVGDRPVDYAWRAAAQGERSTSEFGFADLAGAWRWLRNEYVPLGDGLVAIFFSNVTESRSASAMAAVDAAVVLHAPDTSIIEANTKASEILGVEHVAGRVATDPEWQFLDEAMEPLPVERFPVMQVLAGSSVKGQLVGIRSVQGAITWCEVNAQPRFNSQGVLSDIAVTFFDVTRRENERREAVSVNNRLIELSFTDPLTGMPNRRAVFNAADRMWTDAGLADDLFSVLVVDLDGLKEANDTGGHAVGDAKIKDMAQAIQSELRAADAAGRLGGDEFLVLLRQTDLVGARAVAERMRLAADSLGCAASFGAATLRGGEAVAELVRRADQALYRAKDSGGNVVRD